MLGRSPRPLKHGEGVLQSGALPVWPLLLPKVKVSALILRKETEQVDLLNGSHAGSREISGKNLEAL